MKVAMIAPWKVRCGIYTYTAKLAPALADLGVDVYIVRLPRFGKKTPDLLQLVAARIPRDKVDLIHVQHEYGLYQNLEGGFYAALKLAGKPVVTTMHAVGKWDTDRVVAQVSRKVIVHNRFCARRFGHPSEIIPHGTDPTETPTAEESKRLWGIPPEAPVVGYCGFISSYKGVEFLIEAMKKVPKVALVIAGGWHVGPDTEYILQMKQRSLSTLAGRIKWLGWVPEDRLAAAYGAMDILVYPSRYSTESGALLNAISHGKAVLASRITPFVEKEKQGAVMTFKNRADMPRKIKKLLKSPDLRAKLEEGAKRYAEEHAWPQVAADHVNLYKEVLDAAEGEGV